MDDTLIEPWHLPHMNNQPNDTVRDNICTYCSQPAHRAHRCPRRAHVFPWTGRDLFLSTVLVALIAAGVICA